MSELVNIALTKSDSLASDFTTSRNHFNKYLEYINHDKTKYDMLEGEEISQDLFGKFPLFDGRGNAYVNKLLQDIFRLLDRG
jgi:hypothetical protein